LHCDKSYVSVVAVVVSAGHNGAGMAFIRLSFAHVKLFLSVVDCDVTILVGLQLERKKKK
jgi:hypothetical protein